MKKILITGASGFLASHLIAHLRAEKFPAKLFLLTRQTCDLANAAQTKKVLARIKPHLVFHLAGTSRQLAWEGLWREHVLNTVNLYEALRAAGSRATVILAGSSGEYGDAGGKRPARETSPLEPVTMYGASKLSQALAAFSYRDVKTIEARIFNVLGPGTPAHLAPGAFAAQIAAIEAGRQAPRLKVGDLSTRRDYLDVRDVARALPLLAQTGRPGQAYNVCLGRSLSMRELLERLLALSSRRITVATDPAKRRPGQVAELHGSLAKIRRETGWKPRISLEQSLRDTLNWHRARIGVRA